MTATADDARLPAARSRVVRAGSLRRSWRGVGVPGAADAAVHPGRAVRASHRRRSRVPVAGSVASPRRWAARGGVFEQLDVVDEQACATPSPDSSRLGRAVLTRRGRGGICPLPLPWPSTVVVARRLVTDRERRRVNRRGVVTGPLVTIAALRGWVDEIAGAVTAQHLAAAARYGTSWRPERAVPALVEAPRGLSARADELTARSGRSSTKAGGARPQHCCERRRTTGRRPLPRLRWLVVALPPALAVIQRAAADRHEVPISKL